MTRAEFIERLKKLIEEAENDERTAESVQNVPNDDLISRKAALDALNKMKIYRQLDSDRYVISDCLNKIVNLPAAQPVINVTLDEEKVAELIEYRKKIQERRNVPNDDLISRQAAIDALNGIKISRNASWYEFYQKALTAVGELPSAQPEERTAERTEKHACDCISRQAAREHFYMYVPGLAWDKIDAIIDDIPSAQPEIIRCKDCAKREICRTSTVWAVTPDDDWYCADAERKTDE